MRELARQVEALSRVDSAPALLIGESGTGKGRIAEYIHSESPRAAHSFADINCATVDATTLGVELFGAPQGTDGTSGLLGLVNGGTVLIEEISELAMDQQERLLTALNSATNRVDAPDREPARIIAAASKDLVSEVNAGRFREDLYYRLAVTPIHLPPLRARSREDLAELINATFAMLVSKLAGSPRLLSEEVIDRLIAYPWPGNIRELRNVIERAIMVARGEPVLRRMHLPAELHDLQGSDVVHTPRTLTDVERAHIHRTLRAHKLNRTHAARELGISRATLIKKIKEYGLVYHTPGQT